MTLRGMLAAGILMHCLALRYRVQYGINTKCACWATCFLDGCVRPCCFKNHCRYCHSRLAAIGLHSDIAWTRDTVWCWYKAVSVQG